MDEYLKSALFEHAFWLQILGDHARFIHQSLHPKEKNDLLLADGFIDRFDQLLTMSRNLSNQNVISFTKEAEASVDELLAFKLSLLKRQLIENVPVFISSTSLNHMVNELKEYRIIIDFIKEGKPAPSFHELHHHLLWLLDLSIHADTLSSRLDPTESNFKRKGEAFIQSFLHLYLKAIELTGYMRADVTKFHALQEFNREVEERIDSFKNFLHQLRKKRLANHILSTISPLMIDHIIREVCYYLVKLSDSTQVPSPACDPTQTRLE